MDQAKFIEKFVKALRESGLGGEIVFVESDFSLRTEQAGMVFLANAWRDYQKVSFWKRRGVIQAYAAGLMEARADVPATGRSREAREEKLWARRRC